MDIIPRLFSILILSLLTITACVQYPTSASSTNNDHDYSRTYQFLGSNVTDSSLQISHTLSDILYDVKVYTDSGTQIASLTDIGLQNIILNIPDGDIKYFVTLNTQEESWLNAITLTVNPIQTDKPNSSHNMPISFQESTITCEMWITDTESIYLYERPFIDSPILITLPNNVPFIADTRTTNGWYQITIENITGWLNGQLTNLNGDCVDLPVDTMQNPAQTESTFTAPYDADQHYFGIDKNTGGIFANNVSYPGGDNNDLIQAMLTNQQHRQHINFIMSCTGTAKESLRWGEINHVQLKCGDTLTTEISPEKWNLWFNVILPAVNGQQYVDYQLLALPVAPEDDAQHIITVDRNQTKTFSQALSYPYGDHIDEIALSINNLTVDAPNNYRQFNVSMKCFGFETSYLRWQYNNFVGRCNDNLTITISHDNPIHYFTVSQSEDAQQNFTNYSLIVTPIAPPDDDFWIGIDRNYGGTFSEIISSNPGDASDQIELTMSNLSSDQPNHYREVQLTLYCDGNNTENLRWGLPDSTNLLCGQTVTSIFTYAAIQQTINVIVLEPDDHTYINYVLVATIKPTAGN